MWHDRGVWRDHCHDRREKLIAVRGSYKRRTEEKRWNLIKETRQRDHHGSIEFRSRIGIRGGEHGWALENKE